MFDEGKISPDSSSGYSQEEKDRIYSLTRNRIDIIFDMMQKGQIDKKQDSHIFDLTVKYLETYFSGKKSKMMFSDKVYDNLKGYLDLTNEVVLGYSPESD